MSQPSDATRSAPPFPWSAFIRTVLAAAVIALVIGTLCYHFLADQSWADAALSSAPWIAIAALGTALGQGVAYYVTARTTR